MTEKRFVVENYAIRDRSVDTKYINSYYHIGDNGVAKRLCDLLNELAEENEQLKQLADGNEEQGLRIMTFLHNNYYEIWEEVNKECFE